MNAQTPVSNPVENICWPPGTTPPPGHYKVYVTNSNDRPGGPSRYLCGWHANGQITEVTGTITPRDGKRMVGEFDVRPPASPLAGLVSVAVRAGLIGCGLAVALVFGQAWYAGRQLPQASALVAAIVVRRISHITFRRS